MLEQAILEEIKHNELAKIIDEIIQDYIKLLCVSSITMNPDMEERFHYLFLIRNELMG